MDRLPASTRRPLRGVLNALRGIRPAAAGQARVADWFVRNRSERGGASAGASFRDHPAADALIAGIAEGSPYLWDLVRDEPGRLLRLFQSDPDTRFPAILAEATAAGGATWRSRRHAAARAA